MNEKAFNLFTALIAFILIILSVLLVKSMIDTERNISQIINSINREAELEAVADLTRADILQVFNYYLRWSIEDWLSKPYNRITLKTETVLWNEVKQEFAESTFGNTQFINFTANMFEGFFHHSYSFGNYEILPIETLGNWEETLGQIFSTSVSSTNFFEVIGCPNGYPNDCTEGTFYVNLRVDLLPAEEYEKLPRVPIKDNATGKTITKVILPKNRIKIFVPLRVFKAIAGARALAHTPEKENTKQDFGLYSPRIHNELEQMAFGMCDYGYCKPRENPYFPPKETGFYDNSCPTTGRKQLESTTVKCDAGLKKRGICENIGDIITRYNPGNGNDMKKKLINEIAEKRICTVSRELYLDDPNDGFDLVQGTDCETFIELTVTAVSRESKNINHSIGNTGTFGSGYNDSYFANIPFGSNGSDCPMQDSFGLTQTRNVGLYVDRGNISRFSPISGLKCQGIGDTAYTASCVELDQFEAIVAFKEQNPKYKVNKDSDLVFKIKLLDTFIPFTANYNALNVDSRTCALQGIPTLTNCQADNGWTCKSWDTIGGISGSGPESGCVPA